MSAVDESGSEQEPVWHRFDELLDDAPSEARVHRLWQGTRERLERDRASRGGILPWARWRAPALGLGLVAAALGLGVLFSASFEATPASLGKVDGLGPAGPLLLEGGDAPGELRAAPDGQSRVAFTDASSIVVERGAVLTPVENGSEQIGFRLEGGKATFSITPGGPRRWAVRMGPVLVEVLGTVFSVGETTDADGTRFTEVSVTRGRVRVTSGGESRELSRGQQMRVPFGDETEPQRESQSETVEDTVDEADAHEEVPAERLGSTRTVVAPPSNWRVRAEAGRFQDAYESLSASDRQALSRVEDLLLFADVARLSGHPLAAAEVLERLVVHHAADARASMAAMMLGRLEMDVLHRKDRALWAFRRAERMGVPGALQADLRTRLSRLSEE